jgi:Fe-Mn family superoxide dismutase
MSKFEFLNLPYAYDALEPWIDAQTMEIHHSRHHKTYFTNLQNAVKDSPLADLSLEQMFNKMNELAPVIRNNAGGHWNHQLFWNCMTPKGQGAPKGKLAEAINNKFGSFDGFKEKFGQAAATRFGSGWAWLIINSNNELEITSTANQDNPLMNTEAVRGTPILGLDVWEHAYYLKFQNKRLDYVGSWWNVVNWSFVEELFTK